VSDIGFTVIGPERFSFTRDWDLKGIVAKRKWGRYGERWWKITNPKYSQYDGRHELFEKRQIGVTYDHDPRVQEPRALGLGRFKSTSLAHERILRNKDSASARDYSAIGDQQCTRCFNDLL
jgi:hypothetical protein